MTELLVLGKLAECPTFLPDDVTPELLQTLEPVPALQSGKPDLPHRSPPLLLAFVNVSYWQQLVDQLNGIGRRDLVEVIQAKLAQHDKFRAKMQERDLRGLVRRLDRRFLGSGVSKLHRLLRATFR